MGTILTSQLFSAFIDCPTKCFLRSREIVSDANKYAEWVRRKEKVYVNDYVRHLAGEQHKVVSGDVINGNLWTTEWQTGVGLRINANNLETCLQLVERTHKVNKPQSRELIPIRLTFKNKLTVNDKFMLAFDTLVPTCISPYIYLSW